NMSITALLLGAALWRSAGLLSSRLPPWSPLESNINQTAASACASIVSGGLVAPLPALALLTGDNLPLPALIAWVFTVSFLGIWVAFLLRARLLAQPQLRFPEGIATAETLRELFAHGREAMLRVRVLLGAAAASFAIKGIDLLVWQIPRWSPAPALQKLTFAFDPSMLLLGFGAIIGLRTGLTLLGGALVAWGLLAPLAIQVGWVAAPVDSQSAFATLVEWLLWPGVALMVSSTLVSFALRWRNRARLVETETAPATGNQRIAWMGLLVSMIIAVWLQQRLFGIDWWLAVLAVPLAFLLAMVAARVVGETGVPPIGATGQVSQLVTGAIAPGQMVTNLMAANVAGGAAGQCTDLMNDFKVGAEIGAHPSRQLVAQIAGIAVGSVAGGWLYLRLIPDPSGQLLTAEWPAPAVATWKAVAESVGGGLDAIPLGARFAMAAAAAAGIGLGWLESRRYRAWLPSGAALGLAFIIPASTSLTLFAGAALAAIWSARQPALARRFVLAGAAGLVAGESLFGVGHALLSLR
ncbi:MAG: OPT family oligopeptide transporter, partial [Spongiibacteraceae bacterium]|nr:OPT family oligopeptide transporter [Spongiibacteraceae bacterium]